MTGYAFARPAGPHHDEPGSWVRITAATFAPIDDFAAARARAVAVAAGTPFPIALLDDATGRVVWEPGDDDETATEHDLPAPFGGIPVPVQQSLW